jgi:hypothetical protein
MTRTTVAPEQILEIIRQLDAEGSEPTVTNVRERLGSGSYTTIGTVLYEWRRTRTGDRQSAAPEPPASLRVATNLFWKEAWKAAQAALDVERQSFEQDRAAHLKERGEMLAEISRLEGEGAESRRQVDSSKEETARLSQQLGEFEVLASKLENQVRLHDAEASRLRGESQKSLDSLAQWIERATRAETRLSILEEGENEDTSEVIAEEPGEVGKSRSTGGG